MTSHRTINSHVVFRESATLFRPTTFFLVSRPCFHLRSLFLACDRVPSTDANVTLVIMSPAAIVPPPYDNWRYDSPARRRDNRTRTRVIGAIHSRRSSIDEVHTWTDVWPIRRRKRVQLVGFPNKQIF